MTSKSPHEKITKSRELARDFIHSGGSMQHSDYLSYKMAKEQRNKTAFSEAFIQSVERKEKKRKDLERKEIRKIKRAVPSEI